ncbi:MAG TPA: hypothetical protein PLH49_10840, partial [Chitinophagaceae bacterium]|nr:hypothetical protein [Chitinophagaceae bacterium]
LILMLLPWVNKIDGEYVFYFCVNIQQVLIDTSVNQKIFFNTLLFLSQALLLYILWIFDT